MRNFDIASKDLGWIRWLFVAFPLAVASFNLTRYFFDETIVFPDADRILMDGVFLYDFLKALPLSSPIDFFAKYYAQYPALSIGYRPPLFPALEAVSFLLFGPAQWAAHLAIFITALAGGLAWYRLVATIFGTVVASFSTALLASLPFIGYWSWVTMAEIPTLAIVLITAYLTHAYVETEKTRYAYASAIAFACALWTKQTAIFALLWFIPFVFWRLGVSYTLRRQEVWLASLVFVALASPVFIVSLMLGDQQVVQSVGSSQSLGHRLGWAKLNYYIFALPRQMPVSIIALAGLGVLFGVMKRDTRIGFFIISIVATYIFFTALAHPGRERYTIFWLPSFCLLAALPITYMKEKWPRIALGILMSTIVIINLLESSKSWQPRYVTGLREAASFSVQHNETPFILIHSHSNGTFIYFIRLEDPERNLYVLRSDKLFTASSISETNKAMVFAESREDLRAILQAHAIDLVVADSRDFTNLPIHREFLKYLKSDDFELLRQIPVRSNSADYAGETFNIYRFLEKDGAARVEALELALPIIGRLLRIPLEGGPPEIKSLSSDSASN